MVIQVTLVAHDNHVIVLEVEANDTIDNVKTLIAMEEGSTPLNKQNLIFGGKELKNEHTLEDYGIKNEDMLYMTETVIYNTPKKLFRKNKVFKL